MLSVAEISLGTIGFRTAAVSSVIFESMWIELVSIQLRKFRFGRRIY